MTISQREARRLKRRVVDLERAECARLNLWNREYPGGVQLCTLILSPEHAAVLKTAQKLGHYVVVKMSGSEAEFFASKGTKP